MLEAVRLLATFAFTNLQGLEVFALYPASLLRSCPMHHFRVDFSAGILRVASVSLQSMHSSAERAFGLVAGAVPVASRVVLPHQYGAALSHQGLLTNSMAFSRG